MSNDGGRATTKPYDYEQRGDTFVVADPENRFRLVAEGAQWGGRSSAEVKATIGFYAGAVLVDRINLNLNNKAAKTRIRKGLETEKGIVIPDSAFVALENYIRELLPRNDEPATLTVDPTAKTSAAELFTEPVRDIATDPKLLERISEAIRHGGGWAGDVRPSLIGYVAMTSCLLVDPERPMNLAFVSQAGTGKNKAVDAARALMPTERYFLQRAGSEKSLIYVDEPFAYRVVIFAEADSIPDDGPAASAIRSLASDNVFAYDVPEQNPDTNKFETRRINKPGPTGLITTSTKSLQHQLGTRVLEVHLQDDANQTARIIDVQAAECDGTPRTRFDLAPFIEFQQWLGSAAPHRVIVPFARALGGLVPTANVRMRRDFPQLLSCIRTLAVLHAEQRQRSASGDIIAALADYAAARDLLAPIFDTVAADGVTDVIRATVEAVPQGTELSLTAIAQRLVVVKTTAQYRVSRALKGGWLKNLETRHGSPARLVRGEPLPDVATALPPVDRVREVYESRGCGLSATEASTSGEVYECTNQIRQRPAADAYANAGGENEWFDLGEVD